ncbi:hypothetical protein PsorP6_000086 [Peronosclerospora sorghi]|uniref:Uncharacterized protein n=1 Tax=Peronosclerospora sorghi TaxID=230839 RepID=A0ACC0WQQ1_9STRA|nr:hypothetical protein PsorP6_000086 [Peronosclerospora sorghi]
MMLRIFPLLPEKKKDLSISEVGWSSDPDASVASPAAQAKFFDDFHHAAKTHWLEYYWFIAFDSKWRVTNGDKEVEADFGVFQENDKMNSNFQTLTIGLKAPRALRNAGSKRVLSGTDRSVYTLSRSSDWLVQTQQVWFFDSRTQQVRSNSSDHCRDAYEARDSAIVRVYRCMYNEVNQKWT